MLVNSPNLRKPISLKKYLNTERNLSLKFPLKDPGQIQRFNIKNSIFYKKYIIQRKKEKSSNIIILYSVSFPYSQEKWQ